MTPWELCSPDRLRAVSGVLTDIDDTLTTQGDITPDALQAIHDLISAGIPVIPITGRPIGWCELFARAWPVPAIVAENGAVAWVKTASKAVFMNEIDHWSPDSLNSLLSKSYFSHEASRQANFTKLQSCLIDIERQVPGAIRAQDSNGRETDIAIDHSEFTHLSQSAIDAVVRIMNARGLRATVSSIHINGWIGEHNKWVGAQWIVRQLFGIDLAACRDQWLYIGDSTNDQVMFEAMPLTVGVANIARFESQLRHKPAYVTRSARGAGFAEMTQLLLASKGR